MAEKYEDQKHCCTVCATKRRCSVCDEQTTTACSDCAIDLRAVVYVCGKRECRDRHEKKCPASLEAALKEKEQTGQKTADDLLAANIAWADAKAELAQAREENERQKDMTVADGFGSVWGPCPTHECRLQVVRPGKARCPKCETDAFIDKLTEERDSLRAQLADMQKPVTLKEWADAIDSFPDDEPVGRHHVATKVLATRKGAGK